MKFEVISQIPEVCSNTKMKLFSEKVNGCSQKIFDWVLNVPLGNTKQIKFFILLEQGNSILSAMWIGLLPETSTLI